MARSLSKSELPWLRWWDAQGNLLLTGDERADQTELLLQQERQQRELAEQRAEKKAKLEAVPKLLALGLTVEQITQALDLDIAQVQQAATADTSKSMKQGSRGKIINNN